MLRGIDISQHQEVTPSFEGLSFVILRASIGGLKDTRYDQHYTKARDAGVVVMAYHYGWPPSSSVPVADQVAMFLDTARNADFLWIDHEETGWGDTQSKNFINKVHGAGRQIGLYHSASGYDLNGADAIWIADYDAPAGAPRNRDLSGTAAKWDFHQYTSKGQISGYTGNLDFDVLNPASPLAVLLRLGYVSQTSLDEAQAKVTSLQMALDAQIETNDVLDAENEALSGQVASLTAQVAEFQGQLAAAPAAEKERIALAVGAAEANRIRAI